MTSRFLSRVNVTGFAMTLITAIVWGLARGWQGSASVAIGGSLALLNLFAIQRVMGRLANKASSSPEQSPGMMGLYMVKVGVMALLIFWLISLGRVDVLALALGLSVVPVAILFEWVRWSATNAAPSSEP